MKRFSLLALVAVGALLLAAGAGAKRSAAPALAGAEPSITGVPRVGNTLTADKGKWSGTAPITYSSQWLRCDSLGANCTAISGATATKYTLVSADAGSTIRVRVTAKNADGSKSADSNETGLVGTANGEPVNTKPPVLSGFAEQGVNLHTTTGTWAGDTPMTFAYQWYRCDTAGNACGAIAGQKQASYTVASGDVGRTLRVKVTAANGKGSGSALSEQTAVVTGTGGGNGSSISVDDVPASERLVVDTVAFSPNPVTSRSQPIQVRIRVKDTRGKLVRGALVFLRSTPILTSTPTDAATDSNGWVIYNITPRSDFPLRTGYSVQFYVKAYRQGDKTLEGIYGSRLVQVATQG
jgi:hypothetical protein